MELSTAPISAGTAQHFAKKPTVPARDASETVTAPRPRVLESGAILAGMVFSTVLLSGFVVYHFYVQALFSTGLLVHYGLILGLFYCTIAYQLNRWGAARRGFRDDSVPETDAAELLKSDAPLVTVLIPSYREERRVLVSTVLSAALAQYGNRNIVVLVDDPPGDAESLQSSLAAIEEVKTWLDQRSDLLRREASDWLERWVFGRFSAEVEAKRLAATYRLVAGWLEALSGDLRAQATEDFRHVDTFLTDNVILDLAKRCRRDADRLERADLGIAQVDAEYRKLANLFCSDVSSFQRKRFENLSHAPNKAMNLNAYIGLMGGRYAVAERDGKRFIEECVADACDFEVARPDYVLTLDADSVILNRYILTLVNVLEKRPNVGVAQTPYRTFPNGASAIERIAGATTDIQYLVHQGSTHFDAAYWVGANAVIRYDALKDIETTQPEGDKTVKVFVQDRTVIEDTGSTIDLLERGWRVQNHFDPLAYSATPADFGALAIQRKRWANGGLIIIPALMREYLRAGRRIRRLPELLLRSHYLLSPVVGNVAVLALMLWTSSEADSIVWTPLIMLPYFLLYGLDLRRLGYRPHDLFGVCALNLMLLPVNFAGIASSIRQIVTGRKGSFSRTPKIADRSFIPPYAYLFNLGILALMVHFAAKALAAGQYAGAIIPIANILLYGYGLTRFVGVLEGVSDLSLSVAQRLSFLARPVKALARAGRGFAGAGAQTARRFAPVPALSAVMLVALPWGFAAGDANSETTGVAVNYSEAVSDRFAAPRDAAVSEARSDMAARIAGQIGSQQ